MVGRSGRFLAYGAFGARDGQSRRSVLPLDEHFLRPILEQALLLEEVMQRLLALRVVRRLEERRELPLNARVTVALRNVDESGQIQCQGSRQNAVLAEKIDLDLHPLPKEAREVDVVPSLFVVAAGTVVVDVNLVVCHVVAED